MPAPLRSSWVAAAFTSSFLALAGLAWVTASMTSAPWYDASVSRTVYGIALGVGASIALGQAVHGFSRVDFLDSARLWMEPEIARQKAVAASRWAAMVARWGSIREEPSHRAAVLMGLAQAGARSAESPERDGHDALFPGGLPSPPPRQEEPLRSIVRERAGLTVARRRIWSTLAGPLSVAILFAAIAAIMLPISAGFATADFRVNTALILFLSYGHGPLLLWSLLTLGMS